MTSELFIVNPISGKGGKRHLVEKLRALGCNVVCTEYAGHAGVLARESPADVVVAVGGDGTVNEVASALVGTGRTLGIIPCGSGDGLALYLGLSRNVNKALATIRAGRTRMLDCAAIDGHNFFSVCGVGLDAIVSERFAKAGTRGLNTYIKETLETWREFVPEHYLIDIDGNVIDTRAALVTVGNSNQWGHNAHIAPLAQCDDGQLDITVVHMFKNLEIPQMVYQLFTDRINRNIHVSCYRGRNVTITRDNAGPAHFDGDFFNAGKVVKIRLLAERLKVIVP